MHPTPYLLAGPESEVHSLVCISATSDGNNAFTLANSFGDKISYSVMMDGSEVALQQSLLTVCPGTNPNGSVDLTFVQSGSVQYSGRYTGTITFAILVENTADLS